MAINQAQAQASARAQAQASAQAQARAQVQASAQARAQAQALIIIPEAQAQAKVISPPFLFNCFGVLLFFLPFFNRIPKIDFFFLFVAGSVLYYQGHFPAIFVVVAILSCISKMLFGFSFCAGSVSFGLI